MQINKKQQNDTFSNVNNASRARGLRHSSTYEEFVLWYALPRHEKVKMGLEWQEDFAKYHHLTEQTLSRWKSQSDFRPKVKELHTSWTKSRTSDVIAAMYRSAVSGRGDAVHAQKLWIQVFEGFSEKHTAEQNKKNVVLDIRDIRFIILQFPEDTRQKYYGYLREILDEAMRLKHAGELENKPVDYSELEDPDEFLPVH